MSHEIAVVEAYFVRLNQEMALNYDVDGRSSRLDSTTWIVLFIGLWLVLMLFSMLTSLAYCCWGPCCSFCWQKTASSRSKTIELKSLLFNGAEDNSSSFIEQLLSNLLKTHSARKEKETKA